MLKEPGQISRSSSARRRAESTPAALQLDLKVDRIDRMPSGKYVVLDYKTSDKLNVDDWDGERPDAPQLPALCREEWPRCGGRVLRKLVPHESKLLGHAGEALAWRVPDWTKVVDQLGASFLRGDAAVDPKYAGKTCELCELHSLCGLLTCAPAAGPEDEAGESPVIRTKLDEPQRRAALDPTQSFTVRAPAGSGQNRVVNSAVSCVC